MPKLTHPDSGQTIEVADEQADLYRGQGWLDPAAAKKADK